MSEDRIAILEAAIASIQPQLNVILQEERAIDLRKTALVAVVEKAAGTLSPLTEGEDEDLEDDIIDRITDFGARFGYQWEGHWDAYGSWKLGDPVQFWEPSTC